MKSKRRALAVLAVLLWVLIFPTAALAAEPDIWCEMTKDEDQTLQVAIESSGTATDGVLTVGYDPAAVTASNESVTATTMVDLYACNVTEDGKLMISWVTKDEYVGTPGELFTVGLTVEDAQADPAVTLSGKAFSADYTGEPGDGELTVGPAPTATTEPDATAEPTATTEPDATAEPTATAGSASTAAPGGVPHTGDESQVAVWLCAAAVCATGLALCIWRLRGERRNRT